MILVWASYATLASIGQLKTAAMKCMAGTLLTGGWQAQVEAHNTCKEEAHNTCKEVQGTTKPS